MTQSARWYMDVAGQVLAGMGARTNDALIQFVEENGLSDRVDLNIVQIAWGFEPEPVTPETFIKRTPYANPDDVVSQLDGAVERGWLEAMGEGRYPVSARGTEVAAGLFELGDRIFGGLEVLPDDEMERIIVLLFTVAETAPLRPGSLTCFVGGQPNTEVIWQDGGRILVQAERPLSAGRSKYTCTAPHPQIPRAYYWHTHLFIKPLPDGSWYSG